ncbi:hypothetical protein B0A55_10962 [Friedmanniomyces simplex]|uniref:Acyl-CoA thioesterase-like N-terminal HotDog domain-containing protein n=1 Tax=Friedmanniomyces simplex TaxID=329884 RepID=A0A4V5ND53_9PEZI|nr:hypothetical protein B0A55_10962 [Friedmanniomyces simplex]
MPPPYDGNVYLPFVDLVKLEKVDERTYRSVAQPFAPGGPVGQGRAYGGHVYMQAAWAACQTVADGFLLHNVTGNFLLPGFINIPFVYKVHIIRDGRSYATRIVNVTQAQGKGICFTCTCSFKIPEDSPLDAQEEVDLYSKYRDVLGGKTPEDFEECPGMDLPCVFRSPKPTPPPVPPPPYPDLSTLKPAVPLLPPYARAQSASPLFRLPYELREIIWSFVLDPSETDGASQKAVRFDVQPVHFHVYSVVYDSCTYRQQCKEQVQLRKTARRTAVMRSCWAVYGEAGTFANYSTKAILRTPASGRPLMQRSFHSPLPVQLLYDSTSFEVVLLSGRPRPDNLYNSVTGETHKLAHRRPLGRLTRCTQLTRMRNLTIIVQPGRWPNVKAYRKRLAAYLRTIDYARHARHLTIKFNFDLRTDWTRTAIPIVQSFFALLPGFPNTTTTNPTTNTTTTNPTANLPLLQRRHITLLRPKPPHRVYCPDYLTAITDLAHALHLTAKDIRTLDSEAAYAVDICAAHGSHGAGYMLENPPAPPPLQPAATTTTTGEKIWEGVGVSMAVGVMVVMAPVSVTGLLVVYAARKRRKGEVWGSWKGL